MRTTASVDYGSAIHGLRFRVAVKSLLSIDMAAHLDNNWKPQLLLLYTLQVYIYIYIIYTLLYTLLLIPCCSYLCRSYL